MKHGKIIVIVVLLFAFLISGCGQAVPSAPTVLSGAEEASGAEPATLASFREDPTVQLMDAAKGKVEPVTIKTDMFRAKFEGHEVEGSGEAVDGVYRFVASKTDGEAWHVKLECNYPTVAGRDYRVTYRFNSDVAGKVKFGDFQEFAIQKGENAVTGIMIATGGTSYLDLQLGMLQPFTIDFSEIEVEEYADEVDYEDALTAPVNFEKEKAVYEKHDQGYGTILNRSKDGVVVDYVAVSWETGIWKSRLYVKTGLTPEQGVRYHVTANVTSDEDMPFELLFNNGDEEKGYGALYGQNAPAGKPACCEAVISGSSEGDELVLQFSFGEAVEGSKVKVSDLRVEKIIDHYSSMLPTDFALDKSVETGKMVTAQIPVSYKNIPLKNFSYSGRDTVYETHDSEYEATLEESASSATLKITKAPADRSVWKVRLNAATGVTLEAGTTYRIKYDLASTGNQGNYELLLGGDTDEAYGSDKNRSLTAGGTDHAEFTVTPSASHGPLTLILQLGLTDSTAGNTVTLSGLSVEKVTAQYQDFAAADYGSSATADFWAHHDYTGAGGAVLTSGEGSASLQIKAPPASGREAWKVKLFANSVAQLSANKTYRVSVDVASTEEFEYQICYNNQPNGGGEQALGFKGALHASSAPSTVNFDVQPSADATLSLQFNLGLAADPSTFTISNVKVRELTVTGDTVTTMNGYPVTTHHDAVWTAQTLALSADKAAWDASEASASVSGAAASLTITQAHDASIPGSGVWSTILFVGTGVTPEAGQKYKVGFNITATVDPEEFEIKCNNGKNNDGGYCGRWGQHLSENRYTLDFTAPDSACSELYLSFPLGNSPAGNTVTVSGITVEKQTAAAYDETVDNNFHIVPGNDPNEKATLTGGSGPSAIATIVASSLTDYYTIKLYANTHIELQQGKRYRIDMNVSGADWAVDYKRTNGSGESEFNGTVSFGSTTSNLVTPAVTGNLEIVLKIGKVAVGSTVSVSGITVTELGTESLGDNIAALNGLGYWTHEDYGKVDAGALTASGSAAAFEIKAPAASGREAWKVKLFLNTGIDLTSGKTYRISADVVSTAALDYEICYNNQPNGGGEKALGAEYGLRASTAVQTVSHTVKPDADAALSLQLNLGLVSSPCTVTVSNLKVEESLGDSVESVLPSFSYNSSGSISRAVDEGYVTSLSQSDSSATFSILQAPADRNPWNVKLNVRTGLTPEKGKGYRVSFDLSASKAQKTFELFLDGSSEGAYGQFYGPALKAGKNSISQIIYPGASKGELVLQLRFGKTNGTDGNVYTISNVKIEEVTFKTTSKPDVRVVTELSTQKGYVEQLEKTRDKATVRIEKTPSEGREAWKSKLFIETGVTLLAGQKYRISLDAKSIIPAPFEVCFNHGGVEKGLGAMYGLISTPAGQHVEYTTYVKQDTDLVIQLSLGNCTAPNSIMVSGVKVEKAGAIDMVSDTIYTF